MLRSGDRRGVSNDESRVVGDPVGELQYGYRVRLLEREIQELEREVPVRASVALFFGGRPVWGSQGIVASFAGNVLEKFQGLVSIVFSGPWEESPQLVVTELARGSFGFILDEAAGKEGVLKPALNEAIQIIEEAALSVNSDFVETVASLDVCVLDALREFFTVLDVAGATVRIVSGEREFSLDRHAVRRARSRTDSYGAVQVTPLTSVG